MSNLSLPHWLLRAWLPLLLIGLVCLALAIRLFRLEELMIFTYDQGRDMYVLQSIARGDIKLVGPTTGLPGVFLGPFFYYALLPGYFLSNGSPFGVVKWLMLIITLALPLAYGILKPVVGKVWAVVGVGLLVLAPASFEEARVIWNPSLSVATLLVAVWCLFRSQRQPWWLLGTALAVGLALQTELAYVVFLLPLFLLWVGQRLPWWWRKTQAKYSWKLLLACLVVFGATVIPQLVFEAKYDLLMTRSLMTEMADKTKQVPYAQIWRERPAALAQETVRGVLGTTAHYQWWFTGLLLIALYLATQRRQTAEGRFLWWWFVLPLFGFMLHRGNHGYFFNYYLSPHYAASLLILVMFGAQLTRALRAKLPGQSWFVIPLIAWLVYLGAFVRFGLVIFDIPRFKYTAHTQIQALLAARQVSDPSQTALEVFVPNLVPVAYQYLSEWLSRTGQTAPMDFGLTDQTQYVLLYEPPISDGSLVAYQKWYPSLHQEAKCQTPQQFGITTLEYCQR